MPGNINSIYIYISEELGTLPCVFCIQLGLIKYRIINITQNAKAPNPNKHNPTINNIIQTLADSPQN